MPASLLCDFENGNNNAFNLNQFDNNNDHRALDLEFNWLNIGANTANNNNLVNDLSNLHHANNARSMFSTSNNMASSLTIGANTLLNALEFNDNFKITKRSQNTTECVPVPSSEHVAEIVGRQGCKIKALRAKTNTYIKTPVRGEEPVFVVTGRKEDVNAAKREILSAAEHFSQIRAQRKNNPGNMGPAPNAHLPGHITVQVRVPYRVVGLVVGPKGATIKRIQQQTNTYIITPSRDKDPVFEVTGLPDDVETARKEIEAHIAIRTGGIIDSTTGSTGGTPEESISDFSNSPLLSSFDNLFLSTTGLGNNNMKPADLFGAGFASNINNVSTTAFVDQTKKPMANSTMLSASSRVDTFCSKSQAYKDLCSIFQIKQDNNNTITNSSVCNSGKNTSTGSYDTDEGIGDSPTFDILASGNFNTMWSSESIGNIAAAAGNGVSNGTIPAIDRNNYFMDNFNTVHGSPSSISNNVDFNHRSLSLDSTQSSSSSSSVSCVSTSAPASTSII